MKNNFKRTQLKYSLLGGLAIFLTILVSCTPREGQNANGEVPKENGAPRSAAGEVETSDEQQIFAVNAVIAQEGQIVDYLELSGDVRARTNIVIPAEVGGEIIRLFVDLGDRVARNARIAEIDPSQPGQRFETNIVRAPIAGTIVGIPAQVGMNMGIGMPVVNLAETEDLEVVTRVAERNISRVSIGQRALVRFDAFPDIIFEGRLSEISPILDQITRTLEVRLIIDDEQGKDILPGMYATIRLITEEKQGVIIPTLTLVKRFGKNIVYIVGDDNTVEEREVQVGIEIDNRVELLSGVTSNEVVVYQGQSLLTAGAPVRVVNVIDFLKDVEGE